MRSKLMNTHALIQKHRNPYGEFFHPVPLAALGLLVLNDHWFKGAGVLPSQLTGKISDFAGLLYFPLFQTAALRWSATVLGSVLPVDRAQLDRFLRLTPRKLIVSCALTGVGFTALKLCRPFAELYIAALAALGKRASVAADPTDLWALLSLIPAYLVGMTEGAKASEQQPNSVRMSTNLPNKHRK